MIESGAGITVALVSSIFDDPADTERLADMLSQARGAGANLVVLPELPLNAWSPATRIVRDEDAEYLGGRRYQMLSAAARNARVGVVGGAIVVDDSTHKRHNTTLVFDETGALVATYRKVHLPEEEGFWETLHYEPGDALPSVIDAFEMPCGVQVCSDVNRPEGSHILAALGAEVIICPRATEASTFERWKTVLVANAITSCAFVLSVPRPDPEKGVPLGGPSIAISPTGEILSESSNPVTIVHLGRALILEARRKYPGYLATEANLYAEGWSRVGSSTIHHAR